MLDQFFPERLSLVCELDRLLEADPSEAVGHVADQQPLVVEIGNDVLESLVLLSEQVGAGDFHVVKGNVGGATAPYPTTVHSSCFHSGAALDEEHGDAASPWPASADRHGEVVGPDAVRDPLFLAVDNVVVALLLGLAAEVGDVASRRRFRDGEANDLLSAQHRSANFVAQRFVAESQHGWQANAEASVDAPSHSPAAYPREFVDYDEFVEAVDFVFLSLQTGREVHVFYW
eukprot:CAMPEP_0179009466 /NCGR_PEP_ID=MMETSP0795-20121207/16288_1 /TAXON_ID=88552 /ORGANISM="Amoebophrya sp., Strain Ameob2" /LENGTH=230 /DNA_ID=CAMNT_0020704667 /DNA_START=1021 /DNA_END=1710 /DNA_ORIENTATION=+